MTPQEQEMIGDLIDRVQKTQLAEKDMDAEADAAGGAGEEPRCALHSCADGAGAEVCAGTGSGAVGAGEGQIEQMQQHPEPKHATSFLGSLLGRNDRRRRHRHLRRRAIAPPQGYAPQQAYPQYAPVGGGYGAPMGGGGGFLRGAMQTAAGVAAGALAFEGIESLMHGFGHAAGYGQGLGDSAEAGSGRWRRSSTTTTAMTGESGADTRSQPMSGRWVARGPGLRSLDEE